MITFEYSEYDFGEVDADTKVTCTFKFKNTGGSLLKIQNVQASCNCTIPELKKKEYQTGESGEFSITLSTGNMTGELKKYIYVLSNDIKQPRLPLTVKAKVIRKIKISPDPIILSLKKPNAGCPDINVFSIDSKEFSITGFRTNPDCMKLDFDPNFKATKFIIRPTVDIENLKKNPRGNVFFSTDHPQCKTIVIAFEAPALYKASPETLLLFNAEPDKPITRDKIWLSSNYNEDFEIESTSSEKGYIKASAIQKAGPGRFSFNLQITPPEPPFKPTMSQPATFFTDKFIIKLKNGDQAEISCRGFYVNPKSPAADNKNASPKEWKNDEQLFAIMNYAVSFVEGDIKRIEYMVWKDNPGV